MSNEINVSNQTTTMMPSCEINLLDLPDLVLLNIFEYLPLISIKYFRQTCSRIRQVGHSREIMTRQKYVMDDEQKMICLLQFLMEKDRPHLNLKLDPSHSDYLSDTSICVLKTFLRCQGSKINSLTLADSKLLSEEILDHIMLFCIHLVELHIRSYYMISTIIKRPPQKTNSTLKSLKLSFGDNKRSEGFIIALLNFYPRIETFKLRTVIPSFASSEFDVTRIMNIISSVPLQKLQLFLESEGSWTAISDLNLNWQTLKKLDLFCEEANCFALERLLSRCSQLDSLTLTHIWFDDRNSFAEMIRIINKYHNGIKVLKFDNIYGCLNNISNLRNSELKFPNLREFKFYKSNKRYNGDLTHFKFLENCTLTYLELKNLRIAPGILDIISKSQNTLITLKLKLSRPTEEISTNFLESDSNLRFPKLKVGIFEIDEDPYVPFEASIVSLPMQASEFMKRILGEFNFPRLRILQLYGSANYFVGEKDIKMMIVGCPLLEIVTFYSNQLEKELIVFLCNELKYLRDLEVVIRIKKSNLEKERWNDSDYEKLPPLLLQFLVEGKISSRPCDALFVIGKRSLSISGDRIN